MRKIIAPLLTAAVFSFITLLVALPNGAAEAAGSGGTKSGKPIGPVTIATFPPLADPRSIPYPVYGATPVPGIGPGAKKIEGIAANIGLVESINVAIARSPVLAAARQDVQLARANAMFTAAPALPNVGVNYSRVHNQQQDRFLQPFTFTTQPTRDHPFGEDRTIFVPTVLSSFSTQIVGFLSQLIFDGGKTGYLIRSAHKTSIAQAETYKRSLQTTVNLTTSAYYATLVNERLMLVDVALARMFHDLADFARGEVKAGKADESDVAAIEQQELVQQFQAVKSQNAYVSAQTAFVSAMGVDGYADILPLDDAPQSDQLESMKMLEPLSYDRAIARAMLLRPDFASSQHNVESAAYALKSAERMLYPSLSAVASASDNSTSVNSGDFRMNSSVTLNGTLPIFDQGNTVATRASAKAGYDQALATLEVTRLQVQSDVQTAVTTLVGTRAALNIAHKTVQKAAYEMALRKRLYAGGDAQVADLLDALTTYADAVTQEALAIYDVRQAEQAYYLAVGENP